MAVITPQPRPKASQAAKVTAGKLEIPFTDETELEELAEALERVTL